MKILNENISKNIINRLNEDSLEDNDSDNIISQLEALKQDGDYVDVYGHTADFKFERNDVELYGHIDTQNKWTKATTSSGPNPLDKEFAQLIYDLSNILQGYTHKHY